MRLAFLMTMWIRRFPLLSGFGQNALQSSLSGMPKELQQLVRSFITEICWEVVSACVDLKEY